jgi:hypothetical protein
MYMKASLKILVAVLAPVIILGTLPGCAGEKSSDKAKAAIIDQLYILEPNQAFIDSAIQLLESSGYHVDLWQGKAVTVDFYRKLPAMGYKLIIFRVHSGLLMSVEKEKVKQLEATYLFTAENYTTTKYVKDQLTDKVSNAMMAEKYPLVFAVNSGFIKSANGKFAGTVVILMGCESYYYDDMPAAFIEKGASSYVGWSTTVGLEYVDKATLDLLNNLCSANLTLKAGVSRTMSSLGADPNFGAYLKYYPAASGNFTLKQLMESNKNEKK